MKTYIKICLFLFFFLFLIGIKGVKARDEFSRIIKKEFPVNPDAQLVINNKFGEIHFMNRESNTISIEVKITVTARDQSDANKLMDKISIAFSNSPSVVEARTNMENTKFPGKGHFSVDYMVNMPAGLSLDLTNKFGDIIINEVQGKTKIDLAYGNLEANKLGNSDNLLTVSFGNANIKWLKGAVTTLKYSNLQLDYAGSLRLDSKYSVLDAQKILIMNVNFEGGSLKMDESYAFEGKSKFTDLEIHRITQSLNLDIQYGSCDIEEMPSDFTSVFIKNKYGNVSVGIADKAAYYLEADLRFCDLDFPEEDGKFSFRSLTATEKSYKGSIRAGASSPTSKVTVKSEFGNISLQ